ncbi:MAG: 50S ribosomal protein L25 [Clostridiaceae bacterium]
MAEKKYYAVKARAAGRKPSTVRNEGNIPGVIYGGRLEGGQAIEIEKSVLMTMFKNNTKSSVIDVDFDGNKGAVIVREVQRHPSNGQIIHVDLQAIRKDEILTLPIPITYLGEEEVANRRLIVNTNINELLVKGPADKVPTSIEVDLTGKTHEDKLLASSIKLPEGIEMITDPDELLVIISESKLESELEQLDDAAAEVAASKEPELVSNEKTEE